MKIHLKPTDGGAAIPCTLPREDAPHVVAEGACPVCKADPFHVAGFAGSMVRGHDTYTSLAGCVACKAMLGKLVVTVATIFGIEEDEAVLQGRPRVYG